MLCRLWTAIQLHLQPQLWCVPPPPLWSVQLLCLVIDRLSCAMRCVYTVGNISIQNGSYFFGPKLELHANWLLLDATSTLRSVACFHPFFHRFSFHSTFSSFSFVLLFVRCAASLCSGNAQGPPVSHNQLIDGYAGTFFAALRLSCAELI